jgi:hypothetical protein
MDKATTLYSSSTAIVPFKFPVVKVLITLLILYTCFSERLRNETIIQRVSLKEYSYPVLLTPSQVLNPISLLYQSNKNAAMSVKKEVLKLQHEVLPGVPITLSDFWHKM